MKIYSVNQLIQNNCMQFDHLQMGLALYGLTKGDICKECPKAKGNNCETLIALQAEDKADPMNMKQTQTTPYETVRQEAKRRGVSIKQIRNERRDQK